MAIMKTHAALVLYLLAAGWCGASTERTFGLSYRYSGNIIQILAPTTVSSLVFQQSPVNPDDAVWSDLPNPVSLDGSNYVVTVAIGGGQRYFRAIVPGTNIFSSNIIAYIS